MDSHFSLEHDLYGAAASVYRPSSDNVNLALRQATSP